MLSINFQMRSTLSKRCQGLRRFSKSAPFDWSELTKKPWGSIFADKMYVAHLDKGQDNWKEGKIVPYGPLNIYPAAGILNYAQGILEGLKIQRNEAEQLLTFRVEANAERFQQSAKRLCIPPLPTELFVDAIHKLGKANEEMVPPYQQGSLYVRPILFGSGEVLGVNAAPSYTFVAFAAPVPNSYFGKSSGVHLLVEEQKKRASLGGTGGDKVVGNYAPSLEPIRNARMNGFDNVLFLDAQKGRYLEEAGTSNLFIIKNKTLMTPELRGTILPGITRDSIITLAKNKGFRVLEKLIDIDEVLEADEAFTCGTAVIVSQIASITFRGSKKIFKDAAVTGMLHNELLSIQSGKNHDPYRWTQQIN